MTYDEPQSSLEQFQSEYAELMLDRRVHAVQVVVDVGSQEDYSANPGHKSLQL